MTELMMTHTPSFKPKIAYIPKAKKKKLVVSRPNFEKKGERGRFSFFC
jgi:hypothetical protein